MLLTSRTAQPSSRIRSKGCASLASQGFFERCRHARTCFRISVVKALPERVDVAIIGGGPGGLAAAHALAVVLPPTATLAVFERAPSLKLPRGAGLGLEVNGLKAMAAINPDVHHAIVSRHSTTMGAMEVRDPQGKPIKMLDIMARLMVNKKKYGVQEVQLGWHELVTTLADMLPPQVTIYPGTRFSSYEESEQGVELHLEHAASAAGGTSGTGQQSRPKVVSASLLVAADGYYSKVRQQCINDGPPEHAGAVVWRARVEAAEAARFGYASGQAVNYVGNNRLLLIYKAGHGHVVWTASCTEVALQEAGIDWKAVAEARVGTDILERTEAKGRASKERLFKVFGGFEQPVLDLFAATPPETVLEHGVHLRPADKLRPESFGKGRVVIIGDAAHPLRPTGQGTNQAMEDALLLARYVQQDGGGFGRLDAFREHRTKRLKPIMRHAEVQGKVSYRQDADRPVGAGVTVEPASAALAEGLLEDYDGYVYEGEDFTALKRGSP